MTATVKNCNPTGSEYIYQFSEADYDDMPEELVEKLEEYAELYASFEVSDKKENVELYMNRQRITVNCGFKPNILTIKTSDNIYSWEYEYGKESGYLGASDVEITDTGFTITAMPGTTFIYSAYKKAYSDITTDYYNALTEYYYYKTSMMPRTNQDGKDIGHWKPTTNDSHPQTYNVGDTCYVITLPSYCYLKCIQAGQSGHTEFDCTNVIPSDDVANPKIIDEHDFDPTATVKWEVVRNIVSVPSAAQTLQDIETYVAKVDTITYFEDHIPGVTSDPQQFKTINNNVRDLIQTIINPLLKIDILDDPESYWETTEWFPQEQGQPQKPKAGNLHFYLRVTNTTDAEDVAQTVTTGDDPEWYDLIMKCRVADSLKQHQDYMMELAQKKLKKKDENFTHVYQTEKRKDGNATLTNGSVTVDLEFVPEYVVVQYVTSDHAYTVVHTYDNTTEHYLDGKLATGTAPESLSINSNPAGFTFSTIISNVSTIYYTAVSDVDFRTVIKQYSFDLLDGFCKSYSACRDVFNAYGSPSKDFHGVDLYHTMYMPYNQKYDELEEEMNRRAKTVKEYYNNPKQDDTSDEIPVGRKIEYDSSMSPGLIQRLVAIMNDIHKQLDLKEFLKDDTNPEPYWMWYVFFNYLREGEYQNSNYISDGLANNTLVEYARELLDKGTKELKKATELQYSLSDDLGNLLNTEEFAPFKDKFELGDYIICGVGDNKENLDVDDHNYKLRLISLSYNYGTPESVSVTFANVTKIKNYFSDTKDILAQAKSMGTSYGTVTHQVDKNTDTTSIVNSWNTDGLNSSLTRIMNNNQEEVTYDNNGILIREYDYTYDEEKDNPTYSDEQLKMTHNILAFTKDNWKTASLGLGRQDYIYYDANKALRTGSDYGLIAKFVDAGYIHGSQIISGEIFSENYNVSNNAGAYINLKEGKFSLADGKLTYDGTTLTIDAGTELHGDLTVYDTSTPPKILFKADTDATNPNVQIAGFTVVNNAIYKGVTSVSDTSHTGIYISSDNGIKSVGSTYNTTISNDNFKVANNTNANQYVQISATSFDPQEGGAYNSGVVTVSDGTSTSYLSSRKLYVAEGINLKGRPEGSMTTEGYCGYLYRTGNDTNGYNGILQLKGNSADIILGSTSIGDIFQHRYFATNETYTIDWYGGAFVTGYGKEIHFTLPIPKSATGRTVTSSLNATVVYNGNYVIGSSSDPHYAAITPTITVQSGGYNLKFSLVQTTAFPNAPTYGSVGIRVFGTLTFT